MGSKRILEQLRHINAKRNSTEGTGRSKSIPRTGTIPSNTPKVFENKPSRKSSPKPRVVPQMTQQIPLNRQQLSRMRIAAENLAAFEAAAAELKADGKKIATRSLVELAITKLPNNRHTVTYSTMCHHLYNQISAKTRQTWGLKQKPWVIESLQKRIKSRQEDTE